MNLNEVISKVIQRGCRRMIAELAAESVGEAGVAPHFGSHGPILSLDVAGRDVLGVRVAADAALFNADALRGRIACFIFGRLAVDFLQYRVVHKPCKGPVNRLT